MSMKALSCRATLHKDYLKYHGHKGDPKLTPEICGAVGKKTHVIQVWVRSLGVGNASYP